MTEQNQKEANRHARIVEILLGAVLTVAIAFGGWTVNEFIGIHNRISDVENRLGNVEIRLDNVETRLGNVEARLSNVEERLGRVEARLTGIETALNILVARQNGADKLEGAGETKDGAISRSRGAQQEARK